MSNTEKLFINNWGVLTHRGEPKWIFGDLDPSGNKILQITDFVRALHQFGEEFFGENVGIIRLKYPRPHPTKAKDIMVISLASEYAIVISDPLVTTRLIHRESIKLDKYATDEIRSVLAGAAAMIYSQFYSMKKKIGISRKVVDEIFQEAANAVTFADINVGGGVCSFSAMTLEELLFFHALLKELFDAYVGTHISNKPWGLIQENTGIPIYLEFDTPKDSALIGAFVSVIINYTHLLFDAVPERLIFGSHAISSMDFVIANDKVMVLQNPKKLFSLSRFVTLWKKLPEELRFELADGIKEYASEFAMKEQRERIKRLEFHRVINIMTRMGIRRARGYKVRNK